MDTEDRLRPRAVQQVWLPNLKVRLRALARATSTKHCAFTSAFTAPAPAMLLNVTTNAQETVSLPTQVWARMPAQSEPGASVRAAGAGASSRGRAEAAAPTALPAAAQKRPQQSYTGFGAVHEGTDSDCEIVEDGGSEGGGLPMCPICEHSLFLAHLLSLPFSCALLNAQGMHDQPGLGS